ncbi:MAG: bifunctional DNA-formamidopyrimidine glycosylase/DNA-(apurinic or apyrimidinic site) lyase [Pirellulales bacterium]|nr:bifunctional DNA-formamidopyrimidine glycosylase/DNA-(apurinic or apyrimidinic site) lyase [Pirellulales bacterium]
MPELPEVETMRRGIAAAVGCRVKDLRRPNSRLRSILISPRIDHFRRRLVGRRITAVRRLGKRIVLELDAARPNGGRVVIEPRMTGLVMLADPPDTEHLRLVFSLTGGKAEKILFWDQRGLGTVRLLDDNQYRKAFGPNRLGPDALSIAPEVLRQRMAGSRRAIKVALLDQRALAGVGNIYASEILHRAGIHPAVECRRLGNADWSRLHAAIGAVLRAAVRLQGSTLRDGTYRTARNDPGGYQRHHRVYQRTGERCLSCGKGRIERVVQAQRSTFFCPVCQPPCGSRPHR